MNGRLRRKQCLVIGPYGKPGSDERNWSTWVLQNIVKPVIEKDPFGYEANRTIDDPHPGAITKQIMQSLRTADLVVADLTWANPNVYYELALRHATAKPFIHLAREGTQIPFDIEVLSVIPVSQANEAAAREQLRFQVENVHTGHVDFHTDACEPKPAVQPRAYDWEITYSRELADEWLDCQEESVQKAVHDYNSRGGHPESDDLKHSLLEYLSYRLAHGMRSTVKLYYLTNTKTNHFEGWGVAPPISGRGELTLRVDGYEEATKIKLNFSQPIAHQKIAGLEGDVGPFDYSVEMTESRRRPGEFEGKFIHPKCQSDVLVGDCLLRPIIV